MASIRAGRALRVPNVVEEIRQIISKFNPADPAASVPELLKLRKSAEWIKDDSWMAEKKAEVDRSSRPVWDCISKRRPTGVTPGQRAIKFEAINRSNIPVALQEVTFPHLGRQTDRCSASAERIVTKDLSGQVPDDAPYSQPYWLRKPPEIGTFTVDDQKLIGLPENPPAFPIEIVLQVGGQNLRFMLDTKYRTVDPVAGEVRDDRSDFAAVFANFANPVFVFGDNKPKAIAVRLPLRPVPSKENFDWKHRKVGRSNRRLSR